MFSPNCFNKSILANFQFGSSAGIIEHKQLGSMNAKDRAEAKLKSREEALKQRERELDMKAYRIEAQKQLEEQKLPADLVELVCSHLVFVKALRYLDQMFVAL